MGIYTIRPGRGSNQVRGEVVNRGIKPGRMAMQSIGERDGYSEWSRLNS